MQKHIAIIGGGATGPLLLANIAGQALQRKENLNNVTFHLIDPKGFANGGIAYGECGSEQRLNSVPGEMNGMLESNNFKDFLSNKGIKTNASYFNKRSDYKPFIKENLFQKPLETLRNLGANFELHKTEGYVLEDTNGTFTIVDSPPSNTDTLARPVSPELTGLTNNDFIITTGYGPNEYFLEFEDEPRFIQNIYDKVAGALSNREKALQDPKSKVAIIGSGPALFDITNELNVKYESLKVFSTSGSLIKIRRPKEEKAEQSVDPKLLLKLNFNSSLDEAISALKYEFQENANGRSERRIALDINRNLRSILLSLSESVAVAFRQSTELSEIKHLATPVPLESVKKLNTFDPEFVKTRLTAKNIIKDQKGFILTDGNGQNHRADVIINATGHGRHNSKSIKTLKEQGLASVNLKTNALDTDNTGYILKDSGIAVIGPATHIGTDGMESFGQYCKHAATRILENIMPHSPMLHYRKQTLESINHG